MATPVEQEDMTEYNFLSKLKNFLKHFGHDGVAFIKCMGKDIEKGHCLKDIEHCGEAVVIQQTGIKYKDCVSLLKCEGKDAKDCVQHLHDK